MQYACSTKTTIESQSSDDMFMTGSPVSLSSSASVSSDLNINYNRDSSSSSGGSSKDSSGYSDYDRYENDNFCWFDTNYSEIQSSEEMRNAWMNVISQVSSNQHSPKTVQPIHILHEWHNPQPSLSLKLSSNDVTKSASYGVSISSCVSGFRICQYSSGEIRAEFHFVFSYGSMSYMAWKPYGEFKKLADILKSLNNGKSIFTQTLKEWQFLTEKKRWFRCLDIKYLIEKSIYLGRFMESLLHECPTPGIILVFVKNDKLHSLPSW